MTFTFTGKKFEITDVLRDYAEKKIGKLDRLFRNESDASVTFSKERGRCRAEVTIRNNGMIYRVSELTGDMRASIDSAVASIERQIRKNKTRLEKKLREGAFERTAQDIDIDFEEDIPEEEFKIVREKKFHIEEMRVEDAALQMDLIGHEFFVFRNEDEGGAFSVIYRRKDGNLGLISEE